MRHALTEAHVARAAYKTVNMEEGICFFIGYLLSEYSRGQRGQSQVRLALTVAARVTASVK